MDNNAKDNKIMDSWEEGARDKSTDISSALNIIEFILNTDTQESPINDDGITAGETKLSSTIFQTGSQAAKIYRENSGSTDQDRWARPPYKYTTKTENRDVDQEVIQRGDRRRSSASGGAEIMGDGRVSRGSTDPSYGSQVQESTNNNEIGEMDTNSSQGEVRQFEDISIKIPRSHTISTTEPGGNGDDGRSLESVSTSHSRDTNVIPLATPSDEEELLAKNTRQRKNQNRYQQEDQEIKKGGEKGKENSIKKEVSTRHSSAEQTSTQRSPRKTQSISNINTETERADHGAQSKDQHRTQDARKTNPRGTTQRTCGPVTKRKTREKKEDTEESTQFTERAITLLQNLGVIQSAAKLDLYQDKRVVCAANVLNNADIASKIDFLAGLMIGVSMDHDEKLNQIQNEIVNLKNDFKKMDESHRRLIENQKEQLSLIVSLISNLKIVTERGGKKDQTESNERTSMVKTKMKEEKAKKIRFDPLMESQGNDRNIPDLYRSTGRTPENDLQIRSDISELSNESNATRLIPKRTSNTIRSLVIIINNSNLSPTAKQSYINELKLCKNDEEVSELMEMFNEDATSQ
ncbi:phosphoprotein [Respirovirus rupicaprae]|uniref:Phosphoprotein n=1 Tax=Respirovirus ChamoisRV/IT2014 TaxID=2730603 RepID=A0A6M3TYE5_9MONO|nr:phosphoprotein [Respirovirus ChamoisRV/IT2014]